MTTKEIAQAVGKDERTVQRWVKKVSDKMSSVSDKMSSSSPMNPADFTLSDTLIIIEQGMGKNASDIYRMSAQPTQSIEVSNSSLQDAFKYMASAFDRLVQITQSQETRLQKIETRIEERKALLPPPQVSPRDHISRLVREYATKSGTDFKAAWTDLYTEFNYRTKANANTCAKNRGMKIIDYIESEGQIETLEAIAMEIFKI